MKKCKLLFVMGFMQVGGIEKSLITLCRALDPSEFDISVLILAQGDGLSTELPDYVKRIFVDRFHTSSFDKQYSHFFANLQKKLSAIAYNTAKNKVIRRFSYSLLKTENKLFKKYVTGLFANESFDTVVGFMQGEPSDIAMNCFHSKKKIVFYRHGSILEFLNDKQYYAKANQIIVLSNGLKNELAEKRNVPVEKIQVLYNIIDRESIIAQSMESCELIPSNRFSIATIARISPEKGILCALEAAKILKDNNLDFCWYFIGEKNNSAYLSDCIDFINGNELMENIIFTGPQNNPFPFVRSARIYVQPSLCEALGRTIVEAMVLGKAIVSTRTFGGTELINHNKTGLLCDYSPESLTSMIISLYHSPKMIDTFGIQACKAATKYCGNISDYKKLFHATMTPDNIS